MISKKAFLLISIFLSFYYNTLGQDFFSDSITTNKNIRYKHSALIIPTVLIAYGLIGIESDGLKNWNAEFKEEINEHIDERLTIDDFSQYVPSLAVYALEAFGVKGKNNLRDKTTILATSYLIMTTTVTSLKFAIDVRRPDNSSNNSFPSGHTATAFMGAEFLWQEYKDASVWYGITGYMIAAGTGFFRMYNDRHWLTDVEASASIGILSTKLAYWTNPSIPKNFFQ